MPLQSWNTNSQLVRNTIGHGYPDYKIPHQLTVLELSWEVMSDRLGLKLLSFPDIELIKRTLLGQVSLMFGPLGLLSPITITGKYFIQEA